MDPAIFLAFAVAYVILLGWSIALVVRRGRLIPADLVALVIVGLVYDNALLGLGAFIGEGPGLEAANAARYWLHAFLTPLLVIVARHLLVRAGIKWAARTWSLVVAIVVTVALIAYEIVVGAASLALMPVREYGALSYENANAPEGPPLMVLVVATVLLAAAIVLVVTQRLWWLLVGTALMLIGSAVEIPVASAAATNAFELILLVSIVLTIARQDVPARRGPVTAAG